ncbi:putative hsp70 family protein [Neofusicoccum parvum UCRNP2]|uniref:Putative hsp70 family protein n=1 Tax=Botryosphaeria parva (strain UCR-NP2) TaxID=1287680 RepID=R1GLQ6_BOTPV|nr:putative hsp70 family protein [Neofusicoccum parvum UCRNP2]
MAPKRRPAPPTAIVEDRHKIIVGLDYGTTYTGVSYVISGESGIEDIQVVNQWPGNSESVFKVPSKIAYAAENEKLQDDRWGFTVTPMHRSYVWTKLLLDSTTRLTEFDDPSLKTFLGSGMMGLPVGKSAKEVCCDFLRGVYAHIVETLTRKYSQEIYDATPVECWITVPAIWSDAAKHATRDAAISAGFGARPMDKVKIITEPEAATLAALKPHISENSLDPIVPGNGVLVCDCGGGTVDVTTYKILSVRPKLRFQELCVGIGGKCGSTAIDRNFNKWMIKTFGAKFTDIPEKRRAPSSLFMKSFEGAKRSFTGDGSMDPIEVYGLNMGDPFTYYDGEIINVPWDVIKRCFDPVIKDIIRLVQAQVDHAIQEGQLIHRIILVGGFGDSQYLNIRMKEWCMSQGIKLTCPPQCQAAVAKGAALRGLEGTKPVSRIARRNYGYRCNMPFRKGIDPDWTGYIDQWSGLKYCNNRLEWVVDYGQTINENTSVTFDLHCAIFDDNPDPKIGRICVEFYRKDIVGAPRRYIATKNGYGTYVKFETKMHMDAEEGILTFTSYTNYGKRKQVGQAYVVFNQD